MNLVPRMLARSIARPPRRLGSSMTGRRLGPALPVLFALLVLALFGSAPRPGAEPVAAQDSEIYGLVDIWNGFPDATRIVAGIDGALHVLVGRDIRKVDASGTVVYEQAAGGAREFAVNDRGDYFAVRDNTIFRLNNRQTFWEEQIQGAFDLRLGNRQVYISTIAYNDVTERATAVWDGGGVGDSIVIGGFNRAGVRREEFSVQYPTHTYWDMDWHNGLAYMLNRTRSRVEVYDAFNALLHDVPLPVPAERIAIAADGSFFVLTDREWVYWLQLDGGVRYAWDVSEPEPGSAPHNVLDLAADADGKVYVTDFDRGQVRIYAAGPGDPGVSIPPSPDPICQIVPFKSAAPTFLQLGEKTKVTLTLGGSCPLLSEKADIMLVVDRSGSMSGEKIDAARESVVTFVDGMDLTRDQVGMVSFESEPRLDTGLTQDGNAVRAAARALVSDGGTDIAAGIDVAVFELMRSPRWGDPTVKPIIVLMTDGVPFNNTRMTTVAAGDRARYAGITMYTIGLGDDVDPNLLRLVATAPVLYRFAPDAGSLRGIYEAIARQIAASMLMREVQIVDIVPDNMAYQLDSAVPPAAWDPLLRTLTWTFQRVPFTGVTMDYWVQPLELGRHPTNVRADYDGIDGLDQPQIGPFPVPYVVVVGPETPSPTAEPPTITPTTRPTRTPRPPTETSTPSPTPRATSTDRPTPPPTNTPPPTHTPKPGVPPTATIPVPTSTRTAVPERGRVFVPIVFNEACVQLYTDVSLVIDASTTMLVRTPGGRTKLAAAQEAAKAFVDSLRLERDIFNRHDQASIIWYNDRARVATALTNDRAKLFAAIDSIPAAEGSRIDLGLEFGHRELLLSFSEQRILSNTPVIVLLSDGKPNRTSIDNVVAASDAAKSDGIAVYTVGHGLVAGTQTSADYWPHVLRRIASQPEMYVHAPKADDLSGVYEQIAGELICR